MRPEDNIHYSAVRPSMGLIGWEILGVSSVVAYRVCAYTHWHWLYGVVVGLLMAGGLFALMAQPIIRKLVFVLVAVAAGTIVALLLQMWVDSFIGLFFGLLVGSAVFYWHTIAYDVFQFSNKVRQRTKDRERYLDVRDEFERL